MHVHNEKNFPQAKLDSEINVPFLLNEHGVHNILCNLKKIKSFYRKEKKIQVKVCKKLWNGNYDHESDD